MRTITTQPRTDARDALAADGILDLPTADARGAEQVKGGYDDYLPPGWNSRPTQPQRPPRRRP
jgi:hypothetical protein